MKDFTITTIIFIVTFIVATIFSSEAKAGDLKPVANATSQLDCKIIWHHAANDVQFFVVQRSSDGIQFFPVKMIPFEKDQSEYAFVDEETKGANWFYRIVNVNEAGIGTFSNPIFLEASEIVQQ